MRSRGMAIARWTALAVLGLVLAVALGLATLALTHQHVGLSAEPLSSGTRLARPRPPLRRARSRRPLRTPRPARRAMTTERHETAPRVARSVATRTGAA
jgi:hypothetical protein